MKREKKKKKIRVNEKRGREKRDEQVERENKQISTELFPYVMDYSQKKEHTQNSSMKVVGGKFRCC